MDIKNKLVKDAPQKVQELFSRMKLSRESVENDFTARKGINQTINAHYAGFEVEDSTESKGDFDIVINQVRPTVDGNTATIMKGLAPNDKITFNFEMLDSEDEAASQQAEALVHYYLNNENCPADYLETTIKNSSLFGAGFLHVSFVDEEESRIVSFTGNEDEHRGFKVNALSKGLTVKKLGSEKTAKDIEVIKEIDDNEKPYTSRYKLSKIHKKLRIFPIDDDYFYADNYTPKIQDQQLVGYYDPKNIGEIVSKTGADVDKMFEYGSKESAVNKTKLSEESDDILDNDENPFDKLASTRALQYTWYRDEKEGLLEICWSGDYIVYLKNVDFVPIVKVCINPYPNVLYGSSDARAAIPSQEYNTATARAAMKYAWENVDQQYTVTNRGTVEVDAFEEGDSIVFTDDQFDPARDLTLVPKQVGDFNGIQWVTEFLEKNRMDVTGNAKHSDIINHEIMAPGNSGLKIQVGLSQLNIEQERKIRNSSIGLSELIHTVWRTLVQNGSLPSVQTNCKRVSSKVSDAAKDTFMDYDRVVRNYDWISRQAAAIKLAIGMKSEENKIADMTFVANIQEKFLVDLKSMVEGGIASPDMIKARRRVYIEALEDTFERSDADKILPTMEQIEELIKSHIEVSSKPKEPTPLEQAELKKANAEVKKSENDAAKKQADIGLVEAKTGHQIVETMLTEVYGPKAADKNKSQLNVNT